MATLLAKVKVFAGKEGEFEEACRALHKATQVETGCKQYSYWRAAEDRTYYCLLVFDSYHDFLIHQAADYHEELAAAQGPELYEETDFQWIDPLEDACEGPPTEHQPAGEGDSDTMKKYAEMMPAVVQAWWGPLRRT